MDSLLPAGSCTKSWVRGKETPWTSLTGAWLTMPLAKTFTMPVSPVQQPTTVVTSERPSIPPIQPATGSSVVQSIGPVIQVSSNQTQLSTGTSDPAFSLPVI